MLTRRAFALLPFAPRDTVTFESLLEAMIDREALARFPEPVYQCRQASSRDPLSKRRGRRGWYANYDFSQFIRSEQHGDRTEWVMMHAQGPGAIVRFWMGAPVPEHGPLGVTRIYLDGATEPVIEEEADKLLGGGSFIPSPFSAIRSIGRNLYLPIPYAQSCKVTYDTPNFWQTRQDADRAWYVINYRQYPQGTSVRPFTRREFDSAQATLDRVGAALPRAEPAPAAESRPLEPGQSVTADFKGPAAIRRLCACISASGMERALRTTVVSIEFDGQLCVSSPAGDFFGSGYGLNPFHDWFRAVESGGRMSCSWVMPFERSCRIQLKNLGKSPVEAALGPVETSPWQWDERSMHFHANWRYKDRIRTKKQDGQDWNYIEIRGQGVYVGDTLTIHNGHTEWWGEGDEKIYADGENFPSQFGTGTEDYYGYSFGDKGVFFEAPFHAQPRAEGNDRPGYTVNTRSRVLDAVPFQRSLKFDMEIWHWAKTRVSYGVTTYWYARPGAHGNRKSLFP